MSIIRTNRLQSVAGASFNSVIQVQHYVLRNQRVSTSNTEAKFMETSITTRMANSSILVQVMLAHGSYNADVDLCAAVGYSLSSSNATSGYTSLHGSYSRQTISNLGGFWAQDTSEPGGGTWNGGYFVVPRFYQHYHSPTVPVGTTLFYSVWVGSDGQAYWGSSYSGGVDNGQDCTITLTEVLAS